MLSTTTPPQLFRSKQRATLEHKATLKSEHLNRLAPIIFIFILLIASSCGSEGPFQLVNIAEAERVKRELNDRSFRQFDPSKDASPRKGVILDFFDGLKLWAQYAKDGHAVNEWEIAAKDYRVEKAAGGSEFKIYFNQPSSVQEFPTKCENCIQTSDVSISIRNLFDSEKISFKVNDPNNSLPLPFPVFKSWTKFNEDEYFD